MNIYANLLYLIPQIWVLHSNISNDRIYTIILNYSKLEFVRNGVLKMEEYIKSRQNQLFVHLKKLQSSRSYREQCREFCGDGIKLLEEAIKWYPGLYTVIACEQLTLPRINDRVRIVRVSESLMNSISSMKTPQGVIFLCRMPKPLPMKLEPGCLILDNIQDPGNLGTILRTADALNVPVILTSDCVDPYNEKTVRASMGAILRSQPVQASAHEIIEYCKNNRIPIAATALSNHSTDLRSISLREFAVVIGSEGHGVRKEFIDHSDAQMIIPMQDRCESLNAAVAAAIVLWEMKR